MPAPGVSYPRYPHQFDQQQDAALPLTGNETLLISQQGQPKNIRLSQVSAVAVGSRNIAHLQAQWVQGAIVVNGEFFWSYHAPYAGVITSIDVESAVGTFYVQVLINGVPVGGLDNVFTNNVETNVVATSARTFAAGDQIAGIISGATGDPTNAVLNLNAVWT